MKALLYSLLFCLSLGFAQNLNQVQNLFTSPDNYPARAVAYSPDGSLLAVALRDEANSIKILEADSGREVASLVEHTSYVNSVAFSPAGDFLASGSGDKTVKIWRTADFSLVDSLEEHTSYVNSVAFSPAGDFLASGSYGTVKIWRTADFSLVDSLEEHTSTVYSVAFSPAGDFLASGSFDNTVKIWRTNDFSLVESLEEHTHYVSSVAFSPAGDFLASGSGDDTVKIWRTADFSLVESLEEHTSVVFSVAFSPAGDFLASGSFDNTVKIWRTADFSLVDSLEEHTNIVRSVAFSPAGDFLASGSADNTVKIWHVNDSYSLHKTMAGANGSDYWIGSVAFHPAGTSLAVANMKKYPYNGQGVVSLWGPPSGQAVFCPSGCGAAPPVQYATVTINSTAGARLSINGQAIPERGAGVFVASLATGSHNLRIQKAGHSSIATTLNLQANQNIHFDFPLVRLAPPVQQIVTPPVVTPPVVTPPAVMPVVPEPHLASFRQAPDNLVQRGRRVALVIGNSRYQRTPLQNPVHDAEDMATALGNLGFEVQRHYDLSFADMGMALGNFEASLQSADVGLVFFAGHGVEVDGENYLLPVDTSFSNKFNLKYSSLALSTVLRAFQSANVGFSIVILDACRNNPFNRGGTGLRALDNAALSRDFAVSSNPSNDVQGFFIAYATAPGTVAEDGTGRNSPYTERILNYIYTPNLEIEDMFKNILTDFSQDPTTSQQPWRTDSVVGTFSFAPTR